MTRHNKPLKVIAGRPYRPIFLADMEIACYVLEDGTRVLSRGEMFYRMEYSEGGAKVKIPEILTSDIIAPFIPNDLSRMLKSPVLFKNSAGWGEEFAYPAVIIVDICRVMVDAYEGGALAEGFMQIAQRCSMVLGSYSKSDIIALVDEATGYQETPRRCALGEIIETYLPPERQPWAYFFPEEFYREMFRLHKWNGPEDVKRPSVIARSIDDLVFNRLARHVYKDLIGKKPKRTRGAWGRMAFDAGHPGLNDHLLQVMVLMRISPNWKAFHRLLERAFPVGST